MLDNVLICFVLFFLFYNSIEFLNALFQHFFVWKIMGMSMHEVSRHKDLDAKWSNFLLLIFSASQRATQTPPTAASCQFQQYNSSRHDRSC